MKPKYKILIIVTITIIIGASIQYFILNKAYLKSDIINSVITFLSIMFGFYVTSLAIFSTSSYMTKLYSIEDKNNKSSTLLHTLINEYKLGLILILFSILYFLCIQLFILNQTDPKIELSHWLALPAFGILTANLIYSYFMLDSLTKVIIQEGKNKNNGE